MVSCIYLKNKQTNRIISSLWTTVGTTHTCYYFLFHLENVYLQRALWTLSDDNIYVTWTLVDPCMLGDVESTTPAAEKDICGQLQKFLQNKHIGNSVWSGYIKKAIWFEFH